MSRLVSFLLLICLVGYVQAASVGGDTAPDGTLSQCCLPQSLRKMNVGGSDGAGLCVFTSIGHSAEYQDVYQLKEFQAWMKSHPGGGYPEKVDKMIAQLCQEKGWAKPVYIQNTTGDLELLKKACQSGRMPGITYGFSPSGRYGGGKIAHMVSLVHAKGDVWGILDNNYIKEIEWLNTEEFKKTFASGGGNWSVILIQAGPPPTLRN